MTTALVLSLAAYLIGSISFAVLVSRAFRLPDPRSYGSNNPGATNVMRTGKRLAALFTLAGDGAKGWLAVFIAQRFADPQMADVSMAAAGVAVVIGHMFPLFFGLKGGKGVATALGVILAMNIYLALGTLATWLAIFVFFRISSLAALVAALFAPFFALVLFNATHPYFVGISIVSVLLILRHHSNIRNLIAGTEGRVGRDN